jgi:hypothetical protein
MSTNKDGLKLHRGEFFGEVSKSPPCYKTAQEQAT